MEALRSGRWDEVAQRIDARMTELQLVQADVARLASVSATTVRSLLRVQRDVYRRGSLRSISRALGWVPTALEDFAASGKEPIPWTDPEPLPWAGLVRAPAIEEEPEDLRLQMRRIEGKLDLLSAAVGHLIGQR